MKTLNIMVRSLYLHPLAHIHVPTVAEILAVPELLQADHTLQDSFTPWCILRILILGCLLMLSG